MQLEKVAPSKIDKLQAICIEAYSKNFAHHWNGNGLEIYLENQFNTKRIARDLDNPTLNYYFIKVKEKPIGFIKLNLKVAFDNYAATEVAELEKMYVLPEMKGQGVGKKALSAIIQQLKDIGKKVFFLCVIDTNTSAIKFYEKLDFQYHSKTRLEVPLFKEELKGMHRMSMTLKN